MNELLPLLNEIGVFVMKLVGFLLLFIITASFLDRWIQGKSIYRLDKRFGNERETHVSKGVKEALEHPAG